MVLAWLEVECQMSIYSQMCYENIKSGKVLLELTDAELEAGLGIANTMHRRKLRLAIEEYREPVSRLVLWFRNICKGLPQLNCAQ